MTTPYAVCSLCHEYFNPENVKHICNRCDLEKKIRKQQSDIEQLLERSFTAVGEAIEKVKAAEAETERLREKLVMETQYAKRYHARLKEVRDWMEETPWYDVFRNAAYRDELAEILDAEPQR